MFRENRGRKHLNEKERASIVAFTLDGKLIREIANLLGIADATVVLWQKRYAETSDVNRQPGSGRPRKTTAAEDRRLFQVVRDKPITTAQEIAGMFNNLTCKKKTIFICKFFEFFEFFKIFNSLFLDVAQLNISQTTVRRRLKKDGIRARRAVQKFFISPLHAESRLAFAVEFGVELEPWWDDAIFTDEKTFG